MPEAGEAEALTWIEGFDEVREVFTHPAMLQASYDAAKETVFADVLVTLDGPEHLRRRRAELALVRPAMLSLFERRLLPETARRLLAAYAKAGEADLVEMLRIVTTSMAAELIGLDGCAEIEALDRLDRLTRRMHAAATIDWALGDRERIQTEAVEAREQYRREFFEPSLARHRATPADPAGVAGRIDLLAILLGHRELEGMDEDRMMRETIHYILATAHTSANSVVRAMHDLWTWLAAHPEDASRTGDGAFLQRCVHETLRLNPPTGFQKRVAAEDCVLKSGRAIRKGERIGLNLVTAGRDPKAYGPAAERYDPHRPAPDDAPAYGLAFGHGNHVCLGRRLATGAPDPAEGEGVLVALLRELLRLDCRPDPARPPEEYAATMRRAFSRYPVRFGKAA